MINKIKQTILKYCLIIAGKIDKVKVEKSTIGMSMEIAISKLVPPDGQVHSYSITILYSAKVDSNDDYRGYLMVDDIKVYQNGNPLSFSIGTSVDLRYEEMKGVARQYLEILEEAAKEPKDKLAEFKERLAKSIAPYADNPAFQAFLELKRASKLGE